MEPSLKINDNDFKPLSKLTKKETQQLLDHLLDKRDKATASSFNNFTILNQLDNMISQVEQRLYFLDIGYIKDESQQKIIKKRISLKDDD